MAKQRFTLQFDFEANMGPIKSSVVELQNSLKGITLPPNMAANFKKLFDNLESEMSNFQAMTKNGFENMADVNKAQTSFSKITKLVNQIGLETQKVKGIDPQKLLPKSSIDRVEKLEAAWKELKAQSEKKEKASEKIEKQNQAIKDQIRLINELKTKKTGLKNENKEMGAQKGAATTKRDAAVKSREKKVAERTALEGQKGGKSSAEYQALGQEITRLNGIIAAADKEINRLTTSINKNKTTMSSFDGQIDSAENELTGMKEKLDALTRIDVDQSALTQLRQELANLLGLSLDEVSTDLDAIKRAITGVNAKELESVDNALKQAVQPAKDLDGAMEQAKEGMRGFNREAENTAKAASEMDSLKNSILQFFSITNSIQLFRRAVTSAMNTIKELDATMTEAAVVTDFSINDMWEKMPEYSAQAQKLGVSINGMYQATTLYYQQGLKTNEAMAIGVETMKMARIAGLESADATQAMTAALRGFNMELNETSAVRVNDVYSQLAAVTASNVEQISTAMSKTASIASAANMEFETTAALLAQIIETTQEAPETAGTALKTIIARFSEVKSLREQGLGSGTDAEGEALDVNGIQTALRSVGISMEGFFAGSEGLHQVLLKLAEKWDTLDFETQRYIATMAAGSRQQSRFIAMMSDYARTTELVDAAQNSAGASQKQFNKTMESLGAKLQKLKNAWNQFVMGIANDDLIKFGVDALTEILNVVNKLTANLPGLAKSFANLGIAVGGIALGKNIAGSLLGSVGKSIGKGMGIEPNLDNNLKNRQRLNLSMQQEQNIAAKLAAQKAVLNGQYDAETVKMGQAIMARSMSAGALDFLTKEEQEALAVAVANNIITEEQLRNMDEEQIKRILVAASTKAQEGAQSELNREKTEEIMLNHSGILGLIEMIGLRVMGKTAIKAESVSLKQLIAKKWENVTATLAENAALIAGVAVVLAMVAALAMLVVGVVKLQKAWKDSADNSKKIEKVNNQIGEMQEQITESREELNKLTDSKSSLEQLQESFKGLTRGTEEWRQRLVEVNSAVLDLIQEHPELAGYLAKGESGQLTIRAEGWDATMTAIEQQIATAVTTQTGLQMKKNYLEQQQTLADSSDYFAKQKQMQNYWKSEETKDASGWVGAGVVGGGAAIGGAVAGAKIGTAIGTAAAPGIGTAIGAILGVGLGGLVGFTLGHIAPDAVDALNGTIQEAEKEATGGLTQDEFMAFAAKAQERGITWTSGATQDEFKQIYEEMGYDESIWPDVYEKIRQMGAEFDTLATSSLELRTAQDAYMKSLVSGLAEQAGVDDSEFYDQITEMAAVSGADKQGQIATEAEKILSDNDYTGKNGEAKDKLITEYAAVMNMEKDAVNEKVKAGGLSSETMAQAIAQNKVDKELITEMQRLEKVMSSLPKSADGLKNALTSEGKDLRLENIEEFKKITGLSGELSAITDPEVQKKAVEQYLSSQNSSLEALGLAEGEDWKLLWKNFSLGAESFSKATKNAERWGGKINQTVTAGAANALISKIEKQNNKGADGEEGILKAIADIESKLTDEQVQQLYETLGDFDWENLSSVQSLSTVLYNLGFDMNTLGDSVAVLENKIIKFANSTSQLTLEQKKDTIESAKKLIAALQSGERKRVFTADEAELIFGTDYKTYMTSSGHNWVLKDAFTSTELIDKIKNEVGLITSSESQFVAHEKRTAAQESKGTYDFVKVHARTIARRIPEDNEGGLLPRSASEAAALLGFDVAKVRNSLVMQLFSKLDSDSLGYQYAVAKKQTTKSYAQRLLDKGFEEDNYVPFENGMILDDMENYAYDQKIYNLWKSNSSYALPGLLGNETMDQISEWYEGLDEYGQEYFGAIASGVLVGNSQSASLMKNAYGYYDISSSQLGYYGQETTTDWEMLKRIAEGAFIQDEGDYYGHDEAEQYQITADTISKLYTNYINGDATDAKAQAEALKQYYTDIVREVGDFTQEGYYQEMAFFSGQELLSATEDERLKKRSGAASDVLDSRIIEMTGGSELVESWTKALEKANSELAKNKRIIQALAVDYNAVNIKIDALSQVLEEQGSYFKLGSRAGQLYYEALINIENALKGVLGNHIDTDFIENEEGVKELLIDIQKGGEVAEAAWDSLMQKSFDYWLKTSGLSAETYQGIADYINSQPLQVGVATEIEGTDEMLANWNNVVAGMQTSGIILEKTEDGRILATKTSYTGTGLGALKDTDKWENPYDKFYNTLEKINEAMREREKLERQYQRLVKKGEASADKLTENKQKQLATLQREAELQNDIIAGREGQIANYIKEKGLGRYAYLERNEFTGQNELRINWAEINKIPDTEKGQEVQEYISQLEEWFGSIEEAQDSLEEIEDTVDEINEQGKEEYLDLEQAIKEALVESYQKQIDELNNINDSINDANSKLIEAMQKSIDDYRQARDNEKAEDEIADKQARLAYLQQDTSGANTTEILQLEKEIAEAQEGHIDNLIDQKISALQEQNDKAAEQRERQIDIAQAQLDQYVDSGDIWTKIQTLMDEGLHPDSGLVTNSDLEAILKKKAGFDGMSKIEQMTWLDDTNTKIASAVSYLQALDGKLPKVVFNTGSGDNPDLNYTSGGGGESGGSGLVNGMTKDEIKTLQMKLKEEGYYSGNVDGLYGKLTQQAVQNYQSAHRLKIDKNDGKSVLDYFDTAYYGNVTGKEADRDDVQKTLKKAYSSGATPPRSDVPAFHAKDKNGVAWIHGNPEQGRIGTIYWKGRYHAINAYKTGGLADYTGPAWLDGTKSKPELVLNARDTQNFIQLKDILASLMGNTPSKSSEKAGETTYDIDINVETIKDETDLDMIANYIENKIVASANYRNNTIISGRR